MSEEIDKYINEAVKTELKDAIKKLLIESVDIEIIYKTFSSLSKEEIDEIELEAAEGRRIRISREYWKMYLEDHKDDPNDIMVQIYNDAVENGKREFETMVIKNLKNENVPIEKIQQVFLRYTKEEVERI
jgi:hypothetical protein